MRLLVTGCGRSGTYWLAEMLNAAGVPTGHEEAFTVARHGGGDWTSEVSWLAAPWTPLRRTHVVHLVRHPVEVVRSRVATGVFEHRDRGEERPTLGPWGQFAYRWCPRMAAAGNPVSRAAWHWVQWNRLVIADELLRLEDIDAATVTRLARIVDPDAPGVDELGAPSNASLVLGEAVTWEQVAHVPHFTDTARRYGYEPPN